MLSIDVSELVIFKWKVIISVNFINKILSS